MVVLSVNAADAVVLSVVLALVTLIVRGMLRGTIKTCESGSCGGACASCSHACARRPLALSQEQLEELELLGRQAEERS